MTLLSVIITNTNACTAFQECADVVGELFDENIGFVTYADELDENDFYNFLISQYIHQGETVYVKVSGYNTQTNGGCYVKVGTSLT